MNPLTQNAISLRTPSRSGRLLCAPGKGFLLAMILFAGASLVSAEERNLPDWVTAHTGDYQPGQVLAIEELSEADLVIIAGGYETGFRSGMVSIVQRNGNDIAEVLIVEARPRVMAAVIREIEEGYTIEAGDTLRPRITRF